MSDNFYITGGTLPPAAESYVVRRADAELLDGLRAGEFCYVLDTRQMGKSSLMVRTAQRLREEGRRVAVLDLTALGQNLTVEQWYSGLLSRTGAQMGRMVELLAFWKERKDLGPMQRFLEALREVLLTAPQGADGVADLILFVDEIDAVRILPFSADEFFAGIRECYNRRPEDPAFERLTFCLLGVAAPTDLVRDTRISPFNIGRRIELRDFTPDEAEPLTKGLTENESRARRLIKRVLSWTNGHPYMTQRLCRSIAERLATDGKPMGARYDDALVDSQCRDLFLTHAAQETDDNLAFVRNRLLRSETDVGTLLDFYLTIRQGRRVRDDPANPLCSLLLLSGIVARKGDRLAVRNRIYDHVFDPAWVQSSLPGEEVRRQRQAYLRGALRTAAAGGAILLLVAILAGVALNRAGVARNATARALRQSNLTAQAEIHARARLSRAYVEDATRLLNARDAGAALAPLAEAMMLDQDDPIRMARHRFRFAAALELAPRINQLWSAGGPLRWASFSPDKTRIVAAGEDGQAHMWDVATGQESPLKILHAGAITDAAFSPDGRRLVTCGEDAIARVWDLNARCLLCTLGPLDPPEQRSQAQTDGRIKTTRVAWSPDGRQIATVWGGSIIVWNISAAGKATRATPPFDIPAARLASVLFSPDGKRLAVTAFNFLGQQISIPSGERMTVLGSGALGGCYVGHHAAYSRDGSRLLVAGEFGGQGENLGACVFDAQPNGGRPGRQLMPLLRHSQLALDAVWSADERRIATSGADGMARVWDAATGRPITPPLMHTRPVIQVEFSPDGERVVTACDDGTARVWDATTGESVCAPLRHAGPLVTAQFGADGSHLFTAGRDGTARLWSLPPPEPQPALRLTPIKSRALFSDGVHLAVLSNHLSIYDLETEKQLSSRPTTLNRFNDPPPFAERFILAARFTADQNGMSSYQVWDEKTGDPISPVFHAAQACLSPDGSMLLLRDEAGAPGTVRIVSPAGGQSLLPAIPDAVTSHDLISPFTPDSQAFVIQDTRKSVRLISARTGHPLTPSMALKDSVRQWAFSLDGRYFLVYLNNGAIQAWNTRDTTAAFDIAHGNRLFTEGGLQFSPDGQYAVILGGESSWFCRLDGSHTVRPIPLALIQPRSFIFSPDSKTFVAPGRKDWLWNAATLTPIPLSIDYGTAAVDAAFSPDSSRVLTVLADGTANVWDARSGHPVTAPLHQNGITEAAFSPDGAMAITASAEGACRIWDSSTGEALTSLLPAPQGQFTGRDIEFVSGHLVVSSKNEADIWRLPATSESLDRLQAYARLLSGSHIDPDIGPVPVSLAALRADWAMVNARTMMDGKR